MPEAVIVSAVRTPIGRAGKGSLMDVRPDDLLAFAIREAVGQVEGLDPNEIVDVMVGCGFPQEKQGMNLARRAALLAGLPKRVPGTTVNRFCASSLQTARMAFHAIKAGEGDVYVAAGVESISQVDGYPKDSEELHPKLVGEGAIANVYIPMGLTAENVAEQLRRLARGHGPLRAALAGARGGGAGVRVLRARADAVREGGRHRCLGRRRAAAELDVREAAGAAAGVQAGRQGDGRQRVPAERRRRGARDHVRGAGRGDRRCSSQGADHLERRDRARSGDHGRRADRRRQGRARPRRDDDRRHRRDGAERGVRRAGAPGLPRARRRPVRREAEPARRRDRARPPVRDDRRAGSCARCSTISTRSTARSASRRCASAAARAWRWSSSGLR